MLCVRLGYPEPKSSSKQRFQGPATKLWNLRCERQQDNIHVVAEELASPPEPETQPPWKGRKEEEERGNPTKLVAALADLPPFKDHMDLEDWIGREFRCSSTVFLSAINAGVAPDSDIDYCCEILSQQAIDQRDRSLAREFFRRDQKVGENDEDYARSLHLLAERAFRGCPPPPSSQSDQLGGRAILRGSPTSAYRCETQCNEDQRSQLVGQGRG
ncbi:hypothetical protein TSMEX_009675 [Taenia solium]|eukprot:TsM_000363200 transcript=TsM_000363200 gene=TsM_000363200